MSRSSAEDRAARRIYHLAHCIMRMRHRYGLDLDAEGYDTLCSQFEKGKALGVREDDKRNREGWLQFKGSWVCVSYIPSLRLIGTIMPSPPPLVLEAQSQPQNNNPIQQSQLNDEQIKRAAHAMFTQAMNAGKMPKWLQIRLPVEERDLLLAKAEEAKKKS